MNVTCVPLSLTCWYKKMSLKSFILCFVSFHVYLKRYNTCFVLFCFVCMLTGFILVSLHFTSSLIVIKFLNIYGVVRLRKFVLFKCDLNSNFLSEIELLSEFFAHATYCFLCKLCIFMTVITANGTFWQWDLKWNVEIPRWNRWAYKQNKTKQNKCYNA